MEYDPETEWRHSPYWPEFAGPKIFRINLLFGGGSSVDLFTLRPGNRDADCDMLIDDTRHRIFFKRERSPMHGLPGMPELWDSPYPESHHRG